MKRKLENIFAGVITGLVIIGTTVATNAAETQFTAKYVESDKYTYVCTAQQYSYSDYAAVKITQIYKADGSKSNYQQVYCKSMLIGEYKLVDKGCWEDLRIPDSVKGAGKSNDLYAMGHNPSLDCKISGYWNVH